MKEKGSERNEMTETARYHFKAPMDDMARVSQALLGLGVEFCPTLNMVCLPRENLLDSIFTGADGEYGLEKLNRLLEEQGEREVPGEFCEMPPETRRDLLDLLTLHMDWEPESRPEPLYVSREWLQEFMNRHFPQGGDSSQSRDFPQGGEFSQGKKQGGDA